MNVRFVDDYLLYLLARASTEVSGHFHKQLKQHGLQVAEWRGLATLSDGDGMTLGELADGGASRCARSVAGWTQKTMPRILAASHAQRGEEGEGRMEPIRASTQPAGILNLQMFGQFSRF